MQEISGFGKVNHVVDDLGQFLLLILADHCVTAESET
jgi:hypothetical protein